MLRRSMIGVLALCTFAAPAIVHAQTAAFGTAAEARAMLNRAVTSMKADPANTIAQINKGEGGFRDRDLYVFCLAGGKVVAEGNNASRVGLLVKDLKDEAGKLYGEEFVRVAEEGKVAEVSYMFPRRGSGTTPVPKVSFVTKVADHVCGVGYYKQV
jgi:hypothetical protein